MEERIASLILFFVMLIIVICLIKPKTNLKLDYERSIEQCNHNPICIQEINEGFKNMGYAIEQEIIQEKEN